jgi:hypothetical protein
MWRTPRWLLLIMIALAACTCGGNTQSASHPTPGGLPRGCSESRPCALGAGTYVMSDDSILPGLTLTLPIAGWYTTEQDVGEFNLISPDLPNDRLFFWEDLVAVKSSGAGHGTTLLNNVGTTPDALISWLTSNPDFLVVAQPTPATIGAGIKSTSLVVGISNTAQYGDPGCPPNPRCADLFTKPGLWGDAYGIGGDEEVRLYLATIKVGGQPHTFLVALDGANDADLAHLANEVAPIINSVRLSSG